MSEKVDTIQQDLACPQCEYNLRGLPGDVVECPECGHMVDIARLVTERWTRPWYQAPGFNTLVLPVAWFVLGYLLFFVIFAIIITNSNVEPILLGMVLFVVGVSIWGFLMLQAYRVFNTMDGIWLALLAHVLVPGYVGSVMISLAFAIPLLGSMSVMNVIRTIIVVAIAVVVFYYCRKGERYIAQQCIREYLRRRVGAVKPRNE